MSENIDPKMAMLGQRENAVPARIGKLADSAKEKPVNQAKRRPFGVRDQNDENVTGNLGQAKKADQKPGPDHTYTSHEALHCVMDHQMAIKQEQSSDESEFMEAEVLGQASNPLKFESSDDESMEVENVISDNKENMVSFAEKETEYHHDYNQYLLQMQEQKMFRINPRYMSRQREIDFDMRATLIDWLCELREEFKLHNETLFLAISLIDRFLSVMSCSRDKLQLAGITAMFIAAKYEEVYPPTGEDLVHLTDNTYTDKQLLKLEVSMIKVLKFQVSTPTAHTFLCIYIHSQSLATGDAELRANTDYDSFKLLELLAKYICELTLLQGETFLQFLPSEIAAAALYVAADTLALSQWRSSVFRKSGHAFESMERPIKFVHKFYTLAPRLQWPAIRDKYALDENMNVAKIRPNPTITVSYST